MNIGDKITIFYDPLKKIPQRTGEIAEFGLGGKIFRIKGCSEWYCGDSEGYRHGYKNPTTFYRAFQEGDDELIKEYWNKRARLKELNLIIAQEQMMYHSSIRLAAKRLDDAKANLEYQERTLVRLKRDIEIAQEAMIAAETNNKSRKDRIDLFNAERNKIREEIG